MNVEINWLLALGFVGQSCYGARFFIQWLASERKGESTIPVAFWYLSLAAAGILFVYAYARHDPVIMAGQLAGLFVYTRNLVLTRRKASTA